MSTPIPLSDRLVAPLLLELRDCLSHELSRSAAGPVCRAVVAHSVVTPVAEGCDCECEPAGQGEAWVRLVRLEPNDDLTSIARPACPGPLQAIVELGVYRCIPVSKDGSALPAADVTDTALRALADMNALLRVLTCCQALTDRDATLEYWQPVGPSGGCAGGTAQLRIPVDAAPGQCR